MNYIRVLVPAKQLENGNECIVNNIYKVNCLGLDASGNICMVKWYVIIEI